MLMHVMAIEQAHAHLEECLVNLEYVEHVEKAAGLAEVLLSPKARFPWTMDQ